MPGARRPSLEQLLTTHQSTLETIIKTPRSGGDAEEAKAGINAIYELIGKEEPLTKDKVGAFVQQLGIVLPPAQLETMFAFFAVSDAQFPSETNPEGKKAESMTVDEFRRLVRAVVQSGDLVDCEGGVADSSTEIHAFEPAELKQLQRVFNSVDDDGSGELDYDELARVLEKWGLENVSEADVEQLVKRFDVNKNGKLDFDEFLGLATAAKSLSEGDGESMEVTIRTHFAREHAKMKSLMVRQKIAVDAATLQFFKTDDGTVERAAATAARASLDLAADEETADGARTHVEKRLSGELDDRFLTACEGGKTKELKSLLARGAHLNCTRNEPPRPSALLLALDCRQDKAALALIDAGADCAYRDETGAGAIIKACGSGCLSKNRKLLGKLVEKGAGLNDQDETGLTALLVAIGRGKAEEVEKLIEAGADVNLADSEGTTPLIRAVQEKNKGIVDQLVRANADVNKIDEYNQSATDLAEGEEKIKEVLEKNGGLTGVKILDMAGQQRVPLERLRPDGRGVTRRRSMDEVRRSRAELEPIADGA